MPAAAPVPGIDRREGRQAVILFVALLGFHGWAVSVGWTSFNLPGGEFRQAQTAVSAYWIQHDNNYALAYPTPVLGKPWSVPMEFPLYQWTVAKLSTVTGWPLTQTGRGVNLACFDLSFPALFLLLGRLGVPPARRWVMLGFLLTCPLYVIYGRAFLMETMALMFAVWFLLGYVRTVEQRHAGWLVFTMLCGIGAGLAKVTTFLFILMPAFAWTLVWLWRVRPGQPGGGPRAILRVAAWALAAVALPCVLAVWWIRYADAVKALNPVGAFLVSDNLTSFNLGLGQRWDPGIWAQHWAIWQAELMPALLLAAVGLLAALFLRRRGGLAGLLVFFFLAAQVLFPVLYAYHEYYYVANSFLLMLAVGVVLGEVLDSRLPRVVAWGLLLAIQAGQIRHCVQVHYTDMKSWSFGGTPLTEALKVVTGPEDILVIAGDDWNSMKPYYAQRRALMLPHGRESEPDFVARAFGQLRGETVGALVLRAPEEQNRRLIDAAVRTFGLDPRPVFGWQDVLVYLRADLRLAAIAGIKDARDSRFITLTPESLPDLGKLKGHEVETAALPAHLRRNFSRMTPLPWKYYTSFGADLVAESGGEFFTAHPDTRLWFKVPAGVRTIAVECLISPGAYAASLADGEASDGVEFSIFLQQAGGKIIPLVSRLLDPRRQAADRGRQILEYRGEIPAGADVLIQTGPGPNGNNSRDWAFLGAISIR
ncbi:MAG: hypothetical protein PSW75_11190 [bacterium]|nr:hypothetical protein [bacterium]